MRWLLLRGLGREQRHWGSFPASLSEVSGDRVLTIDPPGFGTQHQRTSPGSMSAITDDIRLRFLQDRDDGEWGIMGISLGGMITLDWCARYPTDFARSVVINSSTADSPLHQRFRLRSVPDLVMSRWRTPEQNARAAMDISCNTAAVDREFVGNQWAQLDREFPASSASITAQVRALRKFKLPTNLATPLLVLASRADRLVSYRCSERIAAGTGAEIRLHSYAGHDLPLEDPLWVRDQVSSWTV